MTDGVIQRGYFVHCAGCSVWWTMEVYSKDQAEIELRKLEWKLVNSFWYCFTCVVPEEEYGNGG